MFQDPGLLFVCLFFGPPLSVPRLLGLPGDPIRGGRVCNCFLQTSTCLFVKTQS